MRVPGRGRIDRDRTVRFTFDGRGIDAHPGDTVASALLANGVRLMGRSFKYHRPRGVLSAGSEEPNALVTVHEGARAVPNTRATVQEAVDGLVVRSQNAWPSLKYDAMEVNDRLAPFLSAGFYYKTFMWPRAAWERLYEPVIRRAAGLGALSGEPDPWRQEKAFAHCDLLVIGGGPAGIMAARAAAARGERVILADEADRLGGRLLSEDEAVGGRPGADWAAAMEADLRAQGVRVMTRTTVTGRYDGGTFGAWERVSHHVAAPGPSTPRDCFWRIHAPRAVMATGALERPIAFPNNDRPGVMTAAAVRTYLHRYGVAPAKRVAVFANNDDAHRTARDLVAAGVDVRAVIDPREEAPTGDYRLIRGEVVDAHGRLALDAITVREGSRTFRIDVGCLAVSGGWNPTIHLACHTGGRPAWDAELAAFLPPETEGLEAVGAAAGRMTTAQALADGARAGGGADVPEAEDAPVRLRPLWTVAAKGRAWLDFQNDVTTKDVRQAAQENFRSVEHMKRYTTQGMATDQGKSSNVAALAVLADATGRTIPETGTTTFRPPYVAVPISAMGAGATGEGFAPERRTTSDPAMRARGAPMIETGLWYRPGWFPAPGETTWRESCDREAAMVRRAVGVADVSTLGKIDVQGPDAAALLDFVYCNTMSTLAEGRCRYGLMLREDGHVMDDGTAARLGPDHFVITTTTAFAGPVMTHLEFVTQALRPDWDVAIASATEQWAQFSVAGPEAKALVQDLVAEAVDLPFMGHMRATVGGVAGRVFRISFSGEHAYEVAVPARHGAALWDDLVARAEARGGGPYGMEALNVLRIEKGFLTHSEITGRVTAFDLGMDRMVSRKKDCVGRDASRRPALLRDREELVGLRAVDPVQPITAGAHLYRPGDALTRANDQGYVTSPCWSPALEGFIALGFLLDGRARHGERMLCTDRLRGVECEVEVCDPVFFDPEGSRVRG